MRILKTTPRKSVRKAIADTNPPAQASTEPHYSTQDQIQEAIRLQAYGFYAQRGYQHGRDVEDWLRAEKIVLKTVK